MPRQVVKVGAYCCDMSAPSMTWPHCVLNVMVPATACAPRERQSDEAPGNCAMALSRRPSPGEDWRSLSVRVAKIWQFLVELV